MVIFYYILYSICYVLYALCFYVSISRGLVLVEWSRLLVRCMAESAESVIVCMDGLAGLDIDWVARVTDSPPL